MFEDEFKGRTILITGATAGIGETAAYRFLESGANVVICARDKQKALAVIENANQKLAAKNALNKTDNKEQLDNRLLFVQGDVTVEEDVKRVIASAVDAFGSIEMAFNNVGWGGEPTPLHLCSADNWLSVMDINLNSMFYCLKHQISQFLRQIEKADKGKPVNQRNTHEDKKQRNYSIVNMSSVYGLGGTDIGLAPYTSSKHGVIGLTSSAALEYAPQGIRVNSVCPGWIETKSNEAARSNKEILEMVLKNHPLNRLGTTDEVADAVMYLVSKASSFITGHHLPIDAGISAKK